MSAVDLAALVRWLHKDDNERFHFVIALHKAIYQVYWHRYEIMADYRLTTIVRIYRDLHGVSLEQWLEVLPLVDNRPGAMKLQYTLTPPVLQPLTEVE